MTDPFLAGLDDPNENKPFAAESLSSRAPLPILDETTPLAAEAIAPAPAPAPMNGEQWVAARVDSEGERRHDIHKDHSTSRPLSIGYETVGLSGEFVFGELVGLMPDLKERPEGDAGVDFMISLRFSVDVKTARKAFNLIHEEGKPFADIYVLAEYDDATKRSRLLGWEWGDRLKRAPTKDFGYGITNHYIAAENLRPMDELLKRRRKPD